LQCFGCHTIYGCLPGGKSDPYPLLNCKLEVDELTLSANPSSFPLCPKCNQLTRPNVLMFGDYSWNSDRTDEQAERYHKWLNALKSKQSVLIIEVGAGSAIATCRRETQRLAEDFGAKTIRINVRESDVDGLAPDRSLGIPLSALQALQEIDNHLSKE